MVKAFKYVPLSRLPFRYLPPNFATAGNMIVGLLAVLFSVKGEFSTAAWLVVLAVFIDGLDGMLARLLKAQSHFGIEFDSFSDFVSFGVAPAAVVLCYLIHGDFVSANIAPLVWISIIAAIFYILMASIRLARFNVQTVGLGDRIFRGIPTTVCAGLMVAFYLSIHKYGNPLKDPGDLVILSCATFVLFGLLMVSNLPLVKLRRRKNPLLNVVERISVLLCVVLAVTRRMPDVLLAVGLAYVFFGVRGGFVVEREPVEQPERDGPGGAGEKKREAPRKAGSS